MYNCTSYESSQHERVTDLRQELAGCGGGVVPVGAVGAGGVLAGGHGARGGGGGRALLAQAQGGARGGVEGAARGGGPGGAGPRGGRGRGRRRALVQTRVRSRASEFTPATRFCCPPFFLLSFFSLPRISM